MRAAHMPVTGMCSVKALDPLGRCLKSVTSAEPMHVCLAFQTVCHACLRSRRQPAASRAAIRCGVVSDAHMRQVEQVQAKPVSRCLP